MVAGFWDLHREPPTLGGALTLRAELEMINWGASAESVDLYIRHDDDDRSYADLMVDQVFAKSAPPTQAGPCLLMALKVPLANRQPMS